MPDRKTPLTPPKRLDIITTVVPSLMVRRKKSTSRLRHTRRPVAAMIERNNPYSRSREGPPDSTR